MNSAAFLSAVREEIARLQQIQHVLENEPSGASSTKVTEPTTGKRKGGMTPEGKARVAEAQRKRWAAKKAAEQAASKPARKQAASPVKKTAKTTGAEPQAKKQKAVASKPAVGKLAPPARKASVKKQAVATKPAAAKKTVAPKRNSADQAAPRKQARKVQSQSATKERGAATEVSAPVPETVPSSPESSSSSE